MPRLAIVGLLLAAISTSAQEQPKATQSYDVKKCAPKVIRKAPFKPGPIHFREGEKFSSSPIISFQILESGEVANAKLKRSSGVADIDSFALRSIKGTKYISRPGCGIIESDAVITVDFTAND